MAYFFNVSSTPKAWWVQDVMDGDERGEEEIKQTIDSTSKSFLWLQTATVSKLHVR